MKPEIKKKDFDFVQWILDGLDDWKRLTDALERVVPGNIAATVPWLASALPAWMAYDNMVRVLGIWEPVAFIGGLTVEGLGIATVNTAVKFWQYNEARVLAATANRKPTRKGKKADVVKPVRDLAPVRAAVSMAAFYFVVVMTLNVVLDPGNGWHKTGKALLSMLAPVGAVTIALNAQFAGLLQKTAERKARRVTGKAPGSINNPGETPVDSPEPKPEPVKPPVEQGPVYRSWHEVPESEWRWIVDVPASDVVKRYRLPGKDPARTARDWKKHARERLSAEVLDV